MDYTLFALVDELAILATTFVVVALTTLWYSPYLFGRAWIGLAGREHVLFDESARSYVPQLAVTLLLQLILTTVVALLLAFAPVVEIPVAVLGAGLFAMAAAGMLLPMVYEGKAWQYCVLHVSFLALSVVVNVLSLYYWPW